MCYLIFLSDAQKYLKTKIGSSGYIAPEVLMGKSYGVSVDCYSLGVITWILLTGTMPFVLSRHGGFEQELHTIMSSSLQFDESWNDLSPESRQFVEACLQIDSKNRITSADALKHPWITKYGPIKYRNRPESPQKVDLFSSIYDGLNNEKMRVQNLLSNIPSSGSQASLSSNSSQKSGLTSGWGTGSAGSRSESRAGSIVNSQHDLGSHIAEALEKAAIQHMETDD